MQVRRHYGDQSSEYFNDASVSEDGQKALILFFVMYPIVI